MVYKNLKFKLKGNLTGFLLIYNFLALIYTIYKMIPLFELNFYVI